MTRQDRFPALLAATTMGVYLLLVVGATTTLSNAATACAAWPACGNGYTLPAETVGWIAIGHRLLALGVGALVVATVVSAFRRSTSRRVRVSLSIVTLAYPLQAGLGAYVAIADASTTSVLHLAVGIVIFAASMAALTWWLEEETGDSNESPSPSPTRPTDAEASSFENDPTGTVPETGWPRIKATAAAYVRLMKPRLMWLLCLVAAAAMALAGGSGFTPRTVALTLAGGSIAIGASGTFNHVLERDVDRRMQRTADRPLAVDLVSVRRAITFGLLLTLLSVGLFWLVNPLAAALGLLAIVFYSVVYTLVLKPNTVQNTVLGGAAGSLPALIGWAAVTGEIGGGGLLLAALIFLWTPAHFYNLALAYQDDYERGGFPMMPVVRGETATHRHILWYLGATLVAAAVLAATADALGALYVGVGVTLGAVFLWAVVRLHYERTESAAFRAFHASNAYLGLLLLAVVLDSIVV
ncbi:heme o synthase [Halopenitus sp. H-Gu1]|uniref:heme o synthase n=1 Tax=Halopenitus sp. H-Gu1 TaxID=3242697 RepID=UPI00359DECF4